MKLFLTFLCVLYFSEYLEGVKFRCDYRYTSHGWFKYHAIPMIWRDARLQCKLEGGVLASPISTEIRTILEQYACKQDIFTGMHATFSKGHFHSLEGIPLDEIRPEWAPYEPDNKNNAESCLALDQYGKLSDVSCEEPRPYVCFRELSNIETNICGTPDPEYRFQSRTNKCYKFHTNAQTFERAHFSCSAEGGHLAIINSEEESRIIREIFAQYPANKMIGKFWKDVAYIGFHNWGEGTEWITLHGQSLEEAGFAKFSGGEPNNSTTGEYCGSVYRNGLLNDLWCEFHYPFICEKKPNYPPVCDIDDENNVSYIPVCEDQ